MGKQEEERLEMTNGLEGGRTERGVSPAGAQDLPEIGGKGKAPFCFWKTWVFLLAPLLASLIFLNDNPDDAGPMRCAYVLIVMAVYWVFEVLPVPVTALIPVFAFPVLGIMGTEETSLQYMKGVNMMFLGGLMMAIGVENSGLHRRVALAVLKTVGDSQALILMGFMGVTGILSMLISNTATTAMMLPIVKAVSDSLGQARQGAGDAEKTTHRTMMLLAVAYAANIGGTGLVTGSPPNLVLPSKLEDIYGSDQPLTFPKWAGFCFPLMMANLLTAWVFLLIVLTVLLHFDRKKAKKAAVKMNSNGDNSEATATRKSIMIKELMKSEYEKLGRMQASEWTIIVMFSLLLALWLFRSPKVITGWGDFFGATKFTGTDKVSVKDASASMLVVFITFALPISYRFWPLVPMRDSRSMPPILEWGGDNGIEKRLPWGVILLLGGGFALSKGCQESGLSEWLSSRLHFLSAWPGIAVSFFISFFTATITEFASNTATANVLVPILVDISNKICLNPIYLSLAATLSCSYAFMLPAATAPNAIVKQSGDIPVSFMIKVGFIMNLLCVAMTVMWMNLVGPLYFKFDQPLPGWVANAAEGLSDECQVESAANQTSVLGGEEL